MFRRQAKFPTTLDSRSKSSTDENDYKQAIVSLSLLKALKLSDIGESCFLHVARKIFQPSPASKIIISPVHSDFPHQIPDKIDYSSSCFRSTQFRAALANYLSGSIVTRNQIVNYLTFPSNSNYLLIHEIIPDTKPSVSGEKEVFKITDSTEFIVSYMDPHYGTKFIYTPPYDVWKKKVTDRLGGVDKIVGKVMKYMSSVLDLSKQSAWPCDLVRAKGCVISGMPGSGKSAIARLIAEYSNLPYECISCPDLFQSDEGSSERRLSSVFQNTFIKVPKIIILDELDMIAGKTSNDMTNNTGLESRVQSLFLGLLDSVNCEKGLIAAPLFIIGLTNRLHALDPRITRPGRLDEIFEIPNLSADGRYQVLERLTNALPIEPSQKDVILRDISHKTHGFIAADLRSLSTQATLNYIRESADLSHQIPNLELSKHISLTSVRQMTGFHFDEAMKLVKPTGLSEFQTKIPNVTFSQLYGIDKIIAEVKSTIIHPFGNPRILSRFKIKPSRGVLVYGPSGVGKSMLCYAIAKELGVNFVAVEASQMISKIVGESEANIAKLFNQARSSTPCILFIDQIDNLIPKRGTNLSSENTGDRIVTSFLTELDGIFTRSNSGSAEADIYVIATTTRPEKLDSAILRPGRLDQHLYIPVPDFECRKSMIEGFIRQMPIDMSAEHVETIARDTEGFSGADIENMFREAALISIRENMKNEKVTLKHINVAMKSIKPSLVLYTETHPI